MEKLSSAEEKRIMDALQTSVGLVNQGQHPNDAIAKVASDQQFGPSYVQRMVEAMNVSKTLAHMKHASGSARADSFPLADAAAILDKLYPDQIVSPAEKQASQYIPTELMRPETQSFMKKSSREGQPIPKWETRETTYVSYSQDPEIVATKLAGQRRGLQRKLADARSDYRSSFHKLIDMAGEVAQYFTLVGCEPFEVVEKKAYAEYGDDGLKIMNLVHVHSGKHIKRATYVERPRAIFDAKRQPYRMIAKMAAAADTMRQKAEYAVDCELQLEEFEKKAGFVKLPERSELSCLLGGEEVGFTKAAIDFGTVAANQLAPVGMAALGLKDPKSDSAKREAFSAVMDPEHEASMNSVRVKAMLNDFASNDPILSSYQPHELTDAYNHVAQLVPNVAMQPMVMRGMLRKLLQQGGVMEPFEAHQVSEIEKRLTGLKTVPELGNTPKPA